MFAFLSIVIFFALSGIWIGLFFISRILNPSLLIKKPLLSRLKFPARVSFCPFSLITKKESFCFNVMSRGFPVFWIFLMEKSVCSLEIIGTLFKFLFKNRAAFVVLFSMGKISLFSLKDSFVIADYYIVLFKAGCVYICQVV